MLYNRNNVVGTVLTTNFTIALLPSMVVEQHDFETVKLQHGEGPIVSPAVSSIGATTTERGEGKNIRESYRIETIRARVWRSIWILCVCAIAFS